MQEVHDNYNVKDQEHGWTAHNQSIFKLGVGGRACLNVTDL